MIIVVLLINNAVIRIHNILSIYVLIYLPIVFNLFGNKRSRLSYIQMHDETHLNSSLKLCKKNSLNLVNCSEKKTFHTYGNPTNLHNLRRQYNNKHNKKKFNAYMRQKSNKKQSSETVNSNSTTPSGLYSSFFYLTLSAVIYCYFLK